MKRSLFGVGLWRRYELSRLSELRVATAAAESSKPPKDRPVGIRFQHGTETIRAAGGLCQEEAERLVAGFRSVSRFEAGSVDNARYPAGMSVFSSPHLLRAVVRPVWSLTAQLGSILGLGSTAVFLWIVEAETGFGLFGVLIWLLILIQTARSSLGRETIELTDDELVFRSTLFGFGRTYEYRLDDIWELEAKHSAAGPGGEGEASSRIAFEYEGDPHGILQLGDDSIAESIVELIQDRTRHRQRKPNREPLVKGPLGL